MKDQNKTKKQLIFELQDLRKQFADRGKSDAPAEISQPPQSAQQARLTAHRLSSLIAHLPGGIIIETPESNVLPVNERVREMFCVAAPPEALTGTDLGLWDWNVQTGEAIFNERWAEMLGYSPAEIEPHINSWEKLIHPDDKERVMETLDAHLKGKAPFYESEHRLRAKDGGWKWILGRGRALERGNNGKPLRVVGTHLDITDKKLAEQAPQESEEQYRQIINASTVGIYIIQDLVFRYVNPEMARLLGYNADEIIDKMSPHDTVLAEQRETVRQNLMRRQSGEVGKPYEVKSIRKDGSLFDALVWGQAISYKGKAASMGTLVDITERKSKENQLKHKEDWARLVAAISNRFVNIHIEEIHSEINRALLEIGKFTGVDRSYIFQFFDNGKKMSNTCEWCNEAVEPQKDNLQGLPSDIFPWWMAKLTRHENIIIPRVADLPPDAKAEKDILQSQNIRSLIVLPMVYADSLKGFLGFDSTKEERTWPEDIVNLLRIVGDTFAGILERKQAEAERQMTAQRRQRQAEVLAGLATSPHLAAGAVPKLAEQLTEAVSALLGTERVGVWLFEEEGGRLVNIDNYTASQNRHSSGAVLLEQEYQNEFKTLKNSNYVAADDPLTDPRTAGYREGYLKPNHITAMLDAVIRSGGRILGTLCFEHVDRPHNWTADEKTFACQCADQLALAISNREKLQSDEKLRALARFNQHIIESAPVGIVTLSREGKLASANPAFLKMMGSPGLEETLKLGIYRPFFQDTGIAEAFQQSLTSGEPFILNRVPYTSRWGRELVVNLKGVPQKDNDGALSGIIIAIEDITRHAQAEAEKAQLEEQLRRSQKLETLGTLAGGIAHDFNNILTPILGYADMALFKLKETEPFYRYWQQVLIAARRAKDLVEQILLFANQREKEQEELYLQPLVKEALQLLRPSIPATIEIRQRIDASCKKVRADATQIRQVIANLCANAWQAMEEKGGMLTIELKPAAIDAAAAGRHPDLTAGEYIRLSVIDSGTGMDKPTLERIFDPFFTTKAVDKGTGLGLSVVHGIVRSHGGNIQVESEPGRGSVFHVYLPVCKTGNKKAEMAATAVTGGQESILVVDDDENVAALIGTMLGSLGYEVEIRHSSVDALNVFRRQPEKYDLLISDLTMPDMTGLDLAKEAHVVRPGFPVMIMTGYGNSLDEDTRRGCGINKVVGKPLAMSELAMAVRGVLDK